MKAVAYYRYGGPEVMELADVPIPQLAPGQALIKIHAASINPVDWKLRSGRLKFVTGKKFPRILGADFSGTVTEIAGEGKGLKTGDAVWGCAHPAYPPGTLAEYCAVPLDRLAPAPPGLSMTEAAALPLVGVTARTALFNLGRIQAGQSVLINGAAGGVGHVAVQMAKAHGAHVTATCRNSAMGFVTDLGADTVIDYRSRDVLESGKTFDIILDAWGRMPFRKAKRIMNRSGVFLDPDLKLYNIPLGLFGKRYKPVMADVNGAEIEKLAPMVSAGTLKPHIGAQYNLSDAVEAITAIERGLSVNGKAVFLI